MPLANLSQQTRPTRFLVLVVVLWECGKLRSSFPYFHSQAMLSVIMPHIKQASSRATAVFAMLYFE